MPDLIDKLFADAQLSVYAPLRLDAVSESAGSAPWWHAPEAVAGPSRERCFYDEDLEYICDLQVRSSSGATLEQFQQMIDHLEAKTECSLIPRTPAGPSRPFSRTPSGPGPSSRPGTSSALHPMSALQAQQAAPASSHPQVTSSGSAGAGSSRSRPGSAAYTALPPQTPNPSPMTSERDTAYAQVTGQLIWEGRPEDSSSDSNASTSGGNASPRPLVLQTGDGYVARWKGRIPVHYVDNPLRRPLMAVTVVLTRRQRTASGAGETPRSGETPQMGDRDEEQHVTLGTLNNADVLSGLGGAPLPRQRILSARTDRAGSIVSDVAGYTLPLDSPTSAPEVSRRSFRILLAVQSALNVRMRTSPAGVGPAPSRAPRSLNLELSVDDAEPVDFEVQDIRVTAGKGGAVILKPIGPDVVVPLDVASASIYQVLFSTEMDAPEVVQGKTAGQVPLAIEVTGQPYHRTSNSTKRAYLATPFTSRWNCMLDVGEPRTPKTSMPLAQLRPDTTRSLFSATPTAEAMDAPASQDIVVSFSILAEGKEDNTTTAHPSGLQAVSPLKPFWVEAIVLNGTNREQSLKLAIPQQSSRQVAANGALKLEDDLHARLQARADASYPIIHLENDISTGVLAPRSCEVVRMRFMALQSGLHSIREVVIKGIDGFRHASLRDVLHVLVI